MMAEIIRDFPVLFTIGCFLLGYFIGLFTGVDCGFAQGFSAALNGSLSKASAPDDDITGIGA
jgi:hypothetical protein